MTTAWTIAIDWDRNNNYTDTYDNVTSRVISAKWGLGARMPYAEVANESTLDLTLDNSDKRFSSEYASSPIFGKVVPQRPVRIQSNDGATTRTHWVGWIDTIQPKVGRYGERTVQITAVGAMQFLKAAETHLTLQQDKRTDAIIADLIKEVVLPPALSGSAWILGRENSSNLGISTYLADNTPYSELDTGTLTLGMAADNWVREGGFSDVSQTNFDVYHAISDITAAEHGKFLFDREGKALFWNRHHLLQGGTPVATFNDAMTDMAYSYAGIDECKNEVIVVCHPRTISTVTTDVLWELGDAIIRVDGSKPRTISIKYEDENKQRVGAKEVSVTDLEFESGSATVAVVEQANGADLTFTSANPSGAVITKCIVRGRKITDSGEIEAKATDTNSIIDFGRRTMRLNLPSIDNLDDAQYIADFERDRRGQPRGAVQAVTVASHGKNGGNRHTDQLARTLGDLITVAETQTGHNANYYIIGEAHELTNGANLWKTTWYLEPAPATYPWKLGVAGRSELGTATRLTY